MEGLNLSTYNYVHLAIRRRRSLCVQSLESRTGGKGLEVVDLLQKDKAEEGRATSNSTEDWEMVNLGSLLR